MCKSISARLFPALFYLYSKKVNFNLFTFLIYFGSLKFILYLYCFYTF